MVARRGGRSPLFEARRRRRAGKARGQGLAHMQTLLRDGQAGLLRDAVRGLVLGVVADEVP